MIIPVKKVKIFLLESEGNKVLEAIQRKKLVMFNDKTQGTAVDTKIETAEIQRVSRVIEILADYQKKKPFFKHDEVEYEVLVNDHQKTLKVISDIENLHQELIDLENDNMAKTDEYNTINPFSSLEISTKSLYETTYVDGITGYVLEDDIDDFRKKLEDFQDAEYEILGKSNYGIAVVLVVEKDQRSKLDTILQEMSFKNVELPKYQESLKDISTSLFNDREKNKARIKEIKNLLNAIAISESVPIKTYHDYMLNIKTRKDIKFQKTDSSIYYEGWIREDKIDDLKVLIDDVAETYELEFLEPNKDETPPTATKNNKFVEKFESITNMFSVPKHDEMDPNPVMSIWYWVFFGIMMGDMGYGILMIGVCFLLLKLMKPKGGMKQLLSVFMYCGVTTIIAGILFGSFFGASLDIGYWIGRIFGADNWTTVVINPVDSPMPMLIFSVAIGAAHLICGLTMKIIACLKRKDILGALADGASWILIIIGVALIVLLPTMIPGIILAGLGLLLILTLAGRNSKKIGGKIVGGLGGLYNITSYLSDLLSYSRILALCLSSAIIAFTMNTLAGMVSGGFGWVFAILIYIVGHVFNIAMGLLSAYVHDGRLQYLEFYGKFYEGGGYEFKPLEIQTKYLDNVTE